MKPSIILHGGAGRRGIEDRAPRRAACREAVERGWLLLQGGAAAIDAVVAAVVALEDDPHFNAGVGSALTSDGRVEMDASVMEGATLAAGAVGAVERIKNPVLLARTVMEDGRHVLLVGPAVRQFAEQHRIPECDPEFLIVEEQRRRLREQQGADGGTVGAVAMDGAGHVAAATSTGGTLGKLPGRVGDSAIIGAGTYADDRAGAVSATGIGEAIIRLALARHTVDRLAEADDPGVACQRALATLRDRVQAHCGLIAVDTAGRVGSAFTTEAMPVAYMHAGLAAPVVNDP